MWHGIKLSIDLDANDFVGLRKTTFWALQGNLNILRDFDVRCIYVACAGCALTDEQLIAEIGTFLMGGLETTAHTLSFTLYCIAANPIVQQHIVQELLAHNLLRSTKHEPLDLTFDRLAQLLYVDAVLKEAMRMFSVVAGFPRCVSIPWSIHNYLSLSVGHVLLVQLSQ